MSGKVTTEPTRRRLSDRQADTVRRLTDAAVAELRDGGYDTLTVRNVARRAGVAPATAYTYFTSKNHLIIEVFWRRLSALPDVTAITERGEPGAGHDEPREQPHEQPREQPQEQPPGTGDLAAARVRVTAVLREIALLVSDEPSLAAACTTAMLGSDPDVQELRLRIGLAIRERLKAALGDPADTRRLDALEIAYAGALLHAGVGLTSYPEMADRLAEITELIVR